MSDRQLMRGSVHLDAKAGLVALEIKHVSPGRVLPTEVEAGLVGLEHPPQKTLWLGHVASELPSPPKSVVGAGDVHQTPPALRNERHAGPLGAVRFRSSPRGKGLDLPCTASFPANPATKSPFHSASFGLPDNPVLQPRN